MIRILKCGEVSTEEIFARIRAGEMPEGVTLNGNIYSYTCKISETQTLPKITVHLLFPQLSQTRFLLLLQVLQVKKASQLSA